MRRLARRRVGLVVGFVVAIGVISVPVALAVHQFTDVPDSSPFHADIAAVKDAGITSGKTCTPPGTPPTYCPSESITREAMAAFVHRGFGRAGGSINASVTALDGSPSDLAVATLSLGGTPGATQFVKVDASLNLQTPSATGCPCSSRYRVVIDGGPASQYFYSTNEPIAGGYEEGAYTGIFQLSSATTYTFRLQATRFPTVGYQGTVNAHADLTAISAPFGSTGGNSP